MSANKRITKDLLQAKTLVDSNIYIHYEDSDIKEIIILMIGPEKTPYAHGIYLFEMILPDDYPFSPPKCKIVTTCTKRNVRLHPNLYQEGKICLSILNTWAGPTWSAMQSISSVLVSIYSILDETPHIYI